MIRDIVATAGFGAFVLLGAASAFLSPQERGASGPPARVRALVGLGIALSLLAGLSRRELWPFATWSLMPYQTPAVVHMRVLVCADSTGRTFDIDHRAWAPLTEEELLSWVNGPETRAPAAVQQEARAALLRTAEESRARVRGGGKASPLPSPLGPLAANSHLLHPDRWHDSGDTPATRCMALRFVERSWNVDSLAVGRGGIAEATLWEYPAP